MLSKKTRVTMEAIRTVVPILILVIQVIILLRVYK